MNEMIITAKMIYSYCKDISKFMLVLHILFCLFVLPLIAVVIAFTHYGWVIGFVTAFFMIHWVRMVDKYNILGKVYI